MSKNDLNYWYCIYLYQKYVQSDELLALKNKMSHSLDIRGLRRYNIDTELRGVLTLTHIYYNLYSTENKDIFVCEFVNKVLT